MSEEQKRENAPEKDHDKATGAVSPDANRGTGNAEVSSGVGIFGQPNQKVNPVAVLLFMVLLMVFLLILISLKSGGSNDTGANSDDPVLATLKADVEARHSELNRQRIAMGLPPLEGGSEPIEDIAARLKDDTDTLVGLAVRFQQMLADKDAEISSRNGEVLGLEKRLQAAHRENSRLQSEMDRAVVSASEVAQFRKSAADMQAQRDVLSRELADVRAQLAEAEGAVNSEDYADLQRRYEEALRAKAFFENRANELESRLGQAELFAKSEDELLPAAVELFRRLRKMEGMKDSDLTTEYSKLGDELGASVLHTLDFETGSSGLSPEDLAQLQNISENEVPDGDLTLIIGYASKTGDAGANEKLSSARATAAAEHFSSIKRGGQKVQAVYMSQTDRFSSRIPERNQICEVWRIRRK